MSISKFTDRLFSRAALRGIIAICIFMLVWEVGARSEQWFGYRFPFVGLVPPPTDVFVSWLPLYHDMGLIGAWLGSLYFGMPLVLMSPLTFLTQPRRWLWAIHRHGGTLTAAPNFAYELCLSKLRDQDLEGEEQHPAVLARHRPPAPVRCGTGELAVRRQGGPLQRGLTEH